MFQELFKFAQAEEGAVTVDWVVLSAAVVGLAFALLGPIQTAVSGTNNYTANMIIAARN